MREISCLIESNETIGIFPQPGLDAGEAQRFRGDHPSVRDAVRVLHDLLSWVQHGAQQGALDTVRADDYVRLVRRTVSEMERVCTPKAEVERLVNRLLK